jgi:hypothetical protein
MVTMLALCALALAMIGPIRGAMTGSEYWLSAVPETVTVAVFVAGLEGLLFSLIPIAFLDGRKVWDWSHLAWFSIALPVGFLFFEALFHNPESVVGAAGNTNIRSLFIAGFLFLFIAAAFWLFCRLAFAQSSEAPEQA